MSNEEFQRLVLEKLGVFDTRFDNLEKRFDNMEARFDNLEARMSKVETRLDNLEEQMSETNGLVKALMHRTEELDAKFDGLLLKTASKDAVERIEETVNRIAAIQTTQGESINILALRQLQTEADVATLKKAK